MPAPLHGSCLCGGIRYEIAGRVGPVNYCHCNSCRKAQGVAFGTNAPVRSEYLSFVCGRELLREYESSPGKFRVFCSVCGSPIYSRRTAEPGEVRLRIGSLDDDPGRRPLLHGWVSEKAPWTEICDGLPQWPRDRAESPSDCQKSDRQKSDPLERSG